MIEIRRLPKFSQTLIAASLCEQQRKMIKYISRFWYILPTKDSNIIRLLLLFLFTPILDTVGVGLIGPFTTVATNPDLMERSDWMASVYHTLGLTSKLHFILLLGVVIIATFYLKSLIYFHVQKYIYTYSYNQQTDLRLRLMRAYLNAPYDFHLRTNTAVIIQNIFNEANKFCNRAMLPILEALANLLIVLFLVLLLAITDPVATLTVSLLLFLAFAIYNKFRYRLAYLGQEASESQAEAIRVLNHAIGGFKDTRVIGCESYFENQMHRESQRYAVALTSFNVLQALPRMMLEAILITFLVGFTFACVMLSRSPQEFTATLSIFAMGSLRLMPSVNMFMSQIGALRNSTYTINKLYYDIKNLEKIKPSNQLHLSPASSEINSSPDKPHDLPVMHFRRQIVVKRLTYIYPGASEPAVQDVSLSIEKGQSIALIGKSGSGKTTLVDVLLGLLPPDSGDILVDDRSIYENLRDWQNMIGYVPQSIFLIDDTIERNIAFGVRDEWIDTEKVYQAIEAAQLSELINELPDGIKTVIGERGVRLSGGQRQRIGIARTLYHGREILVLDEATSALDSETEALVSDSIKSLIGSKTMIIIAHRLSTIEHCDRVYLLDKGKVLKTGTYREVVEDKDQAETIQNIVETKERDKALANTSYDFRSNLNPIMGFLKLLLDEVIDNKTEAQQLMNEAYSSALEMLKKLEMIEKAQIKEHEINDRISSKKIW